MSSEFIPYQEALALKHLGFNMKTFAQYTTIKGDEWILTPNILSQGQFTKEGGACVAPLFQQAFRWFREKYNMLSNIYSNASGWCFEYHDNIGGTHRLDSGYTGDCEMSGTFTSYEKAELACLQKLISICKEKATKK